MQQTSLTQAVATAKINQIEEAKNSAFSLANNMQDITNQMTSSSWLGHQSNMFGQKMQQYDDDFRNIVNQLGQLVDTCKQNITTLVNHDSE